MSIMQFSLENNCYGYLTISNYMSGYITNVLSESEFSCGTCNKNVLNYAIESRYILNMESFVRLIQTK